MSRRIILGLLVLIIIAAGIYWLTQNNNDEASAPVLSVSAFNQTKNAPADTANPSDTIVFTLTAENQSDEVIEGYIMEVGMADITNNASLVDASGASYNSGANSLVWTPLDIPANDSIQKQFSVKVNAASSQGQSLVLKVRFNNELTIGISGTQVAGNTTPPPPYVAPSSGPSDLIIWFLASLSTVVYAIRKKLLGITSQV